MIASDDELAAAILALLAERREGASICPSDVARALAEDWRPLMQPVRDAARRLVDEGAIVVTQRGRVIDLGASRSPIRLRRR